MRNRQPPCHHNLEGWLIDNCTVPVPVDPLRAWAGAIRHCASYLHSGGSQPYDKPLLGR